MQQAPSPSLHMQVHSGWFRKCVAVIVYKRVLQHWYDLKTLWESLIGDWPSSPSTTMLVRRNCATWERGTEWDEDNKSIGFLPQPRLVLNRVVWEQKGSNNQGGVESGYKYETSLRLVDISENSTVNLFHQSVSLTSHSRTFFTKDKSHHYGFLRLRQMGESPNW